MNEGNQPTPDSTHIGVRLRQIREERGISQSTLAKQSGLSQAAISRIEACEVSPSISTVRDIEKALGEPKVNLLVPGNGLVEHMLHESLEIFLNSALGKALNLSLEEIDEIRSLRWFTPQDELPGEQEWLDFIRLRRFMRKQRRQEPAQI